MYLEDMSVRELKDYTKGLYAILPEDFTQADRENLKEVKQELNEKGWDFSSAGNGSVRFEQKRG